MDDIATTQRDKQVVIDVLANDSDPDGEQLSVVAATQGAHGEVMFGSNQVRYRPDPGHVGADQFAYTISDGEFVVSGTVTVTVLD